MACLFSSLTLSRSKPKRSVVKGTAWACLLCLPSGVTLCSQRISSLQKGSSEWERLTPTPSQWVDLRGKSLFGWRRKNHENTLGFRNVNIHTARRMRTVERCQRKPGCENLADRDGWQGHREWESRRDSKPQAVRKEALVFWGNEETFLLGLSLGAKRGGHLSTPQKEDGKHAQKLPGGVDMTHARNWIPVSIGNLLGKTVLGPTQDTLSQLHWVQHNVLFLQALRWFECMP